MTRFINSCAVGLALGLCTAPNANAILYTASEGSRAASVNFAVSGSTLSVTLANTSTFDTLVPIDVLTGVFFDFSGGATLTPVSALLGAGSTVIYDSQPAGGVVGGEWAYGTGLSGAPGGATRGISSSGLGLFGGATFPGPDLASPTAINGLQYGIVSAGDNAATGNGGITGSGGLIRNSVVFTFSFTGSLSESAFSNVSFQYGTALTEPNMKVPDAGTTLVLLGGSLIGLGALRRRFSK